MRKRIHALLWGIGMLLAVAGVALAETVAAVRIRQVEEMQTFPSVRAYVSLLNGEGKVYQGTRFPPEGFAILENGVEIGHPEALATPGSRQEVIPLVVVLVIDLSGSMAYPNILPEGNTDKISKIVAAQKAALNFIKNMRPSDRLAILPFHTEVPEVSKVVFSSDKAYLKTQVEALQLGINTALYSAVARALEAILPQNGRKVIILLTDGKNDVKPDEPAELLRDHQLNEVKDLIQQANITIYSVGFGNPRLTGHEGLNEKVLKGFADLSHGEYFQVSSGEGLLRIYQGLQRELIDEYALTFKTRLERGQLVEPVHYQVKLGTGIVSPAYRVNFSWGPLEIPRPAREGGQHSERLRRTATFFAISGTLLLLLIAPWGIARLRESLIPPQGPSPSRTATRPDGGPHRRRSIPPGPPRGRDPSYAAGFQRRRSSPYDGHGGHPGPVDPHPGHSQSEGSGVRIKGYHRVEDEREGDERLE